MELPTYTHMKSRKRAGTHAHAHTHAHNNNNNSNNNNNNNNNNKNNNNHHAGSSPAVHHALSNCLREIPLTESKQEAVAHAENERIPSLVLVIEQGVDTVADEQREECPAKVPECHLFQRQKQKKKKKFQDQTLCEHSGCIGREGPKV